MARPTTRGNSLLGPKTVGAFVLGALVGLVLVAPAFPDVVGDQITGVLAGGGSVILVGVGALALLMVLMAVFYQFYL